jgi:hypothetical protein
MSGNNQMHQAFKALSFVSFFGELYRLAERRAKSRDSMLSRFSQLGFSRVYTYGSVVSQ